ncbi:MAG: class I adenylate-forming enzyme family protein [Solirubrobacteraceae bacterium]
MSGPTSVGELLADAALRAPDALLVVGEHEGTTADLDRAADVWARRLAAAGVLPGQHVGILLDPRIELLEVMFGAARLGAVVVPISDRLKAAELRFLVAHADLTFLVTTDAGKPFVDFPELLDQGLGLPGPDGRRPAAPLLQHVVMLGEDRPGYTSLAELDQLVAADRSVDVRVAAGAAAVRPEDPAYVMYTSGTSADPKGCLLSHGAWVQQGAAIGRDRYELDRDSIFWTPLPLFHNGGIATLMACLDAGCGYIHTGRFSADRGIDFLARYRCTHAIPTFETIWLPILEHPRRDEYDLSTLQVVLNAGTPESLRQMQAKLPWVTQLSNYGSTEATGHMSMATRQDDLVARTETCGLPLPGMEVRIADPETGALLPPNARGEIQFRGTMCFIGYYHAAPGVAEAAFTDDGWFHTGDAGTVDETGHIAFHGRLKDMLKVGGENVSAAEVEAFLNTHPAVRLAQVVGAPDDRYTEVPVAFIELVPGTTLTEQDVIDACIDQIATFKIPRYVRFVDEWPMSGTKIQKFVLRERIATELQDAGQTLAPSPRASSAS